MFKKWLAILGAVVLMVCSFQLLWGVGGDGDENPWHGATGSGGTVTTKGTGSAAVNSRASSALIRVFIVRPAPMGGFYLIPVSLPSDAFEKTAAGGKKAGN